MLCEQCLQSIIVPKLREDDIAILQYLYNNDITLPQMALHKNKIAKEIDVSYYKNAMALFRLECYNMVEQQAWSKASNYYLTSDGVRAVNILIERMS